MRELVVGFAVFGVSLLACGGDGAAAPPGPPSAQDGGADALSASEGTPTKGGPAPTGPECATDADCAPTGSGFCKEAKCQAGVCVTVLKPVGTPLPSQRSGDCLESRCAADGTVVQVSLDTDVFDDGNPCTENVCVDGVAKNVPKADGFGCTGGYCSAGTCLGCIPGSYGCVGGLSCTASGFCAAPKCLNGLKDPGEGDVDCGGVCEKCSSGKSCAFGAQCASGVCSNGTCAAPTCSDGVKNGAETGADCGGPDCPACPVDSPCSAHSDCQSNVCVDAFCAAPTCFDAVKNGDEAGTDCGGSCAACR